MISNKYSDENLQNFNNIMEKVLNKAGVDADFRILCLEKPMEAFKKATGMDWPKDADKLKFSEKEDSFSSGKLRYYNYTKSTMQPLKELIILRN